ncbi:LPXTG cell wall anchor domain-containing protein [Mobilitalea sibirica]|uniref:LPXTG cell wall anchor domain-containing protein n=1 Tax=Mobilitalea sibirica TaxID=1462919 RepID=A0A8J7KX31_9FIRM|nr:LPXTG cell wall anchor domain-containing protein [Mobilitalea sibirica]MBH1941262.1 LPXTG cell wall anchor domain-containing protein [Mobilitalea sibirica]
MKLRNKLFAGFAATVLTLSMMVGSAFGATIDTIDSAAGAREADKAPWWIVLVDGAACDGAAVTYHKEIADVINDIASIDFVVNGNCSVEYHVIYQGAYSPDGSGYDNNTLKAVPLTVDGVTVVSADYDGSVLDGTNGSAVAFLLRNKTEGELSLEQFVLRNADGDIIGGVDGTGYLAAADAKALFNELTGEAPAAEEVAEEASEEAAPAAEASVPKTGVVSSALLLGLGAVAFGTGSVVLKKREK